MEIAQLSTRYYPPAPGGVERHVHEVAIRLGQRGHSVRVLTSDLRREYPWERLPPEVPRHEATGFGSIDRLPVWSLPGELHYPRFRGLLAALERHRPGLVHVHTYGTDQVAAARRHRRRLGTPYVLSAHFHPVWSIMGGWLRHRLRAFYDRRIGGPGLSDASVLLVQSREEERLMRALGAPMPPVRIVPPGHTPLGPPGPPGEFARRFGLRGPYAIFVGRLAPNKGLLPLVEGFHRLAAEDPEASLVVVGDDGGAGAALDAAVRRFGLGERVRRVGHVDDEGLLAGGIRDARCLVLPSEYEAFGLVLLDALALGTPVVASRVGGIPEFVEDGRAGLLVPPADGRALGEALVRLWQDPARAAAWGRYGREEVAPRYTWEALVDRLEGIYREVLAGGPAREPDPGRAAPPARSSA
ncbi:MAG: glycosyltransferase family 4 protein [Thermoplasmata archaeon]